MPEQPVAPELPNVILMEPQPAVPEAPKKKMDEKDKNTIAICGILGAIIVFGIVGIILTLVLRAGIVPSSELAKSVCEGRGGEFVDNKLPNSEFFSESYMCQRTIRNGADYEAFAFEIEFLKDGKEDEYWSEIRNKLKTADSHDDTGTPIVIEDSDELIMAYFPMGGFVRYYFVAYEDVVISIASLVSGYDSVVGNVLVELGFPGRVKNELHNNAVEIYYDDVDKESSDELGINAIYLGDMNVLATVFEQYQANNYGKLPAIKDGTISAIDEYLEDNFVDSVTGNKYTIKAFADFAKTPYATDDSELSKIKSDEMYVFYKATCEDDKVSGIDSSKRFAVVHATSEGTSYICAD